MKFPLFVKYGDAEMAGFLSLDDFLNMSGCEEYDFNPVNIFDSELAAYKYSAMSQTFVESGSIDEETFCSWMNEHCKELKLIKSISDVGSDKLMGYIASNFRIFFFD